MEEEMAYEVYVREFASKSTVPTITISPLGRCSLNRSAAAMFDKEAVENVILLWDRESLKFAIRNINKKDARSFNIRYTRKDKVVVGAQFSGVMFFKHIGYDYSKTATYPIRWNNDENLFEVELSQERFQGQQPLVTLEGGKRHDKTGTAD